MEGSTTIGWNAAVATSLPPHMSGSISFFFFDFLCIATGWERCTLDGIFVLHLSFTS